MAGQYPSTTLYSLHDESVDAMNIDEGSYLVLDSAIGAFSCKTPKLPRTWSPTYRPHVALLLPVRGRVSRIMLSSPAAEKSNVDDRGLGLDIDDLGRLPERAIIEVKLSATDFSYYRKDGIMWTKIAESNNPFTIDVFSYGLTPLKLGLSGDDSALCFAL